MFWCPSSASPTPDLPIGANGYIPNTGGRSGTLVTGLL